jgi:hypothetical protein
MSTQPKTIQLSGAIYTALEEAALREHKSLSELGGELIIQGLRRKASLEELIDYGHSKAKETHPDLSEQGVVEIVHARRQARKR